MNIQSGVTNNRFVSSDPDAISTKEKTLEASIRVFIRFGSKKTTMSDIAEEAGLARQTVHAAFGSKANLVEELVRFMSRRDTEALNARFPLCKTLGEKLDAYIEIAVFDIYDLFQQAKDPLELVFGNRAMSEGALREVNLARIELIENMLSAHMDNGKDHNLSVRELAVHITSLADRLKLSTADRPQIAEQAKILKKVVLAVASKG